MAKQSTEYKNKFLTSNYDSLRVVVPKGRKADVEACAGSQGTSVNGLVNGLLRRECGMTEEEWKRKPAEGGDADA